MKDDSVKQKILDSARAEFMDRGFAEASMRTIAERAGYTTGMLYSRFADKEEIFEALVGKAGDELYDYFVAVQNEFASFEAERQQKEMHSYVDRKIDRMIDIVYENFDAFRLIICKSTGSRYADYVDKMIDVETRQTVRFIGLLQDMGVPIPDIRKDLNHMLASALFNGMFEIVRHELPKEDALAYVKRLQEFFNAGWDRLLGL